MAEVDSSEVVLGGTSMPRGLVVILAFTGLLVTTLALQQFSSIITPVLLALVLVVGVHPLTGYCVGGALPSGSRSPALSSRSSS